jgi:hypothetical protein
LADGSPRLHGKIRPPKRDQLLDHRRHGGDGRVHRAPSSRLADRPEIRQVEAAADGVRLTEREVGGTPGLPGAGGGDLEAAADRSEFGESDDGHSGAPWACGAAVLPRILRGFRMPDKKDCRAYETRKRARQK